MKEIIFEQEKISVSNAMYFEEPVPIRSHYNIETYVNVPHILLEIKNKSNEYNFIQKSILSKNTYLIDIDGNEKEYYIYPFRAKKFIKYGGTKKEKLWLLFIGVSVVAGN